MMYKCSICGYIYNEKEQGKLFSELPEDWKCPLCTAPKFLFEEVEQNDEKKQETNESSNDHPIIEDPNSLDYLGKYIRTNDNVEKHMDIIHEMAKTGSPVIAPMKTQLPIISWDDILILGAQLNPFPLNEHDDVNTKTTIGKKAKKPMVIESPVYITHMSFGALSKELKISLSRGAAANKTAMCSGEGGILPEEMQESYKYIFEYVPNKYSVTDDNLKNSDAIEIKIGQGTKPGMGGHLPAEKVTKEISEIRNKPMDHDI